MENFESVLIMKKNISEEKRNEIIDKIKKLIETEGEIKNIDVLGLKKLAYDIKGNNEGFYYVIYFKANPEKERELEKLYRTIEEIIKFLVVKTDE